MNKRSGAGWGRAVFGALLAPAFFAAAVAGATSSPEEIAIGAVLTEYARAIETKDLDRFRTVKPTLSPSEEQRLKAAFANTESHTVKFTVQSIEVKDARAVVHLSRRDTIGAIVASFPQTLSMSRGVKGWTIDEIGK